MPETKPIPVRLDDDLISRLDAAALRMGTNRAALIRFLVKTFLDHYHANGKVASLPMSWRDIMRSLDGRTTALVSETPAEYGKARPSQKAGGKERPAK